MTGPEIVLPIRDWLSRIENKLDHVDGQMRELAVNGSKTAQDAISEIHALELRVQALELRSASQAAVRAALTAAAGAPVVSVAAAWWLARGH